MMACFLNFYFKVIVVFWICNSFGSEKQSKLLQIIVKSEGKLYFLKLMSLVLPSLFSKLPYKLALNTRKVKLYFVNLEDIVTDKESFFLSCFLKLHHVPGFGEPFWTTSICR